MADRLVWVDCDDTLVLWANSSGDYLDGMHPYGYGAERWNWNVDLLLALRRFLTDNPTSQLVIWSGGMAPYAREWTERLLEQGHFTEDEIAGSLSKVKPNLHLPREALDVAIDDAADDLKVSCPVYLPGQFIRLVAEGRI